MAGHASSTRTATLKTTKRYERVSLSRQASVDNQQVRAHVIKQDRVMEGGYAKEGAPASSRQGENEDMGTE
eukprot:356956-Chlamydomonas_euryale.AAC.2